MNRLSRRDLLERGGALSLVAAFGTAACSKPQARALVCGDTTGLSDTDIQVRTVLAYRDSSADPARACDKCLQFLPPDGPGCGGCKVVKGPISPQGSCKSFAPRSM